MNNDKVETPIVGLNCWGSYATDISHHIGHLDNISKPVTTKWKPPLSG